MEAENDIPIHVPIHVLDLNHPLANPATPTDYGLLTLL